MSDLIERRRTFAARLTVFIAAFALITASSIAQESQSEEISAVTELYNLENLLPVVSSGELGTLKDIAAWCLDMARVFKERLAEAQMQVGLQREAKKAEIKALETREKAAGKAKDEELKKQLAQEVKKQKLELDILDSVKELTAQEAAASGDFEAAGKSLRNLAAAYQDLTENREEAVRKHGKAIEEATQAGLTIPELTISYSANEKALKILSEAGKNINDLGERLMKVAKARLGLLAAWEKRMTANVKK